MTDRLLKAMARLSYQKQKSLSIPVSVEKDSLLDLKSKRLPVVEKILKQLTPERVRKEIEAIQKIKLPPGLQKWVREYEKVGERDEIIWLLSYRIIQTITLPEILRKRQKSLENTKFLISMFMILLDDVADKIKSEALLSECLKIPFKKNPIQFKDLNLKEKDVLYLNFAIQIWDHIIETIKKYPGYKKFKEVLQHDINQILLSIHFSLLINKNFYLINKTEYWQYFPYTMQGIVYATLDLMCFPKFNIQELGTLREIAWYAQKMARIGNWVSTWAREVIERDFTSGVFAYAIDVGSITTDELKKGNTEIIKKIKDLKIEEKLLKEWEQYYWEIKKFNKKIKSVNVSYLLSQLEKLLVMHLTIKNI